MPDQSSFQIVSTFRWGVVCSLRLKKYLSGESLLGKPCPSDAPLLDPMVDSNPQCPLPRSGDRGFARYRQTAEEDGLGFSQPIARGLTAVGSHTGERYINPTWIVHKRKMTMKLGVKVAMNPSKIGEIWNVWLFAPIHDFPFLPHQASLLFAD
jgi:hypothetical protein